MSDEERNKPLVYHFWCIKGERESIIVDTGIAPEHKDGIIGYISPATLLEHIGVDAKKVEKVIITHLHQNHFSDIYLFDNADFYVQEEDFRSQAKRIAERRFMREKALLSEKMQEDLKDISCLQRVHYVNGEEKIIDGVTCHLVGGHTPGMQVVSAETENGRAVICSDLAYLFRNLSEETPVGSFWNLHQTCEGLHKSSR
ncbi:MAG: MBL fold metallo-hydrolase [Thaumarchaeota archaeon]|nr:MBL fold metallo-hydrolase [Nitrososphaerota archaeon]